MTRLILSFMFMIHISTVMARKNVFMILFSAFSIKTIASNIFFALIIYSKIISLHMKSTFYRCLPKKKTFYDFSKQNVNFFYCDMSLISVIQFIIHKRVFLFLCLFSLRTHEPLPTIIAKEIFYC